jgi:hypothetical protein
MRCPVLVDHIKTTGSRSSIGKPSKESRHLYAGHHLHSLQVTYRFIPRYETDLGFDVSLSLTTRQQWFRAIRLSLPHLLSLYSCFTPTLMTITLYNSHLEWFETCS